MPCPSCVATVTTEMSHRATLSYRLCTDGGRPGAEKAPTDGHDPCLRAVRETLGPSVYHRTSRYMNNRSEQDQRGSTQRSYPTWGFGSSRLCHLLLYSAR